MLHLHHSKETVTYSPDLYLGDLGHRTSSYPISLSEVIHKPFALAQVFHLSNGRESIIPVKKKAPSRSGFSASMHVVLKTRYVNPNILVRRY